MKKIKNENTFLIIWCSCLVFLLSMCLYGVNISFKTTNAYFGDGTTGSFTKYGVYYYSNYPEGTLENVAPILDKQDNNWNRLLDNMFQVPEGYEFVGWKDENGVLYDPGYVQLLAIDLNMYAEWKIVSVQEPEGDGVGPKYGDVNENGEIDENDYLLLENHISGTVVLEGQALKNADVNTDGKVDLIDVDIVKNACLGTKGYTGFLPNSPILIYDIYEGSIDIGNGDGETSSDTESEETGGSNTGSGTGSGISGSGNGSSGHGGTSSNSGGGTSGGNSSSSNASSSEKGNSSTDKDSEKEDDKENSQVKSYEFKFMNGNLDFTITTCETLKDTCELVLPKNNPARNGYSFKGWSENKDCYKDSIFNAPIMVDKDKTYYACYEENDIEENGNKDYVWIIVFAISLLSIRLIWYLIYRFKEKEKNSSDVSK